jgi:hypothetical protein
MSREKTSPPSRTRRNLGLASSPTLTGWLIRCEYGHVCQGWFPIPAFPRIRECCSERSGAVKGAPGGAAMRTLDGSGPF